MDKFFIAVAKPDATPDLAFCKIMLRAPSLREAVAKLPETMRSIYTVHAMTARAAAKAEAAMQSSARSP